MNQWERLRFACELSQVQIVRLHWKSTGEGLVINQGGFGNVVFIATLNNSLSVPGSIMPTNLTATSCDVYFDLGYGWKQPEVNCSSCVPFITAVAHLPYDFPVAALFNSAGLPAEPFSLNVTAPPARHY
jgi:hypothetical protein